ncbi:MAG: acyl-CoA dehydrogenase [Deltaproteobacteria bacterium SG8_13]|nr:MAG: acyl-CoA dehydrogenase [Deltaproteobacteria bacterium SG8_13]
MPAIEDYWPLADRQRELQQAARQFAQTEIRPQAAALDRSARFARDIYQGMGRQGLLGITIPSEWGGAGADTIAYALVMEELSVGYASIADQCGLVELCATLLHGLGTDYQKKRYLAPLLQAEATCSFALTEPDAGSDLGALVTTAEKTADGFVLNGSKIFIHNGPICDFALVLARTPARADGPRRRAMSIFIVEADTPGFSRGAREHKMGQRASELASLYFKDCRLTGDALLGTEGDGFKHMMMVLEKGRIGIASLSLGISRSALEESLQIFAGRVAAERPGADTQTIQWTLANMATDIYAARAMIAHASGLKDRGIPANMHASMAKLFASESAVKHTTAAVQIVGLQGYTQGSILERLYRDAKVTQIYEGTSEVQRIIISRDLQRNGLMP